MFIPPGYHINAEIEGQEKPDESINDPQPYAYPAGLGSMIMNGCWGTGYKKGDPCFNALEASDQCRVSNTHRIPCLVETMEFVAAQ